MRFQVLGPVAMATDDGIDIPLRPQARLLTAFLLANVGTSVTADQIADVLGSTSADGSGVRMAMSRLRRVIGDRVERTSSGYRLVPGRGELDSHEFEEALLAADGASASGRVDPLTTALSLWRGEPYGEYGSEPWAVATGTRLAQQRLGAIEDLADAMVACGDTDDAARLLQSNVEALRYRERSAALLMEALALSGRVTEALRAYQEFRRSLVDDIGVEPTDSLRRLEADLLADDSVARLRARRASAPVPVTGNFDEPPSSFVGRVDDLSAVVTDLATNRLVSLIGPGGVGKTRLALAVGSALASDHPDGVWFVDLAPLQTDESVAHLTADTLGTRVRDEGDLPGSIAAHMRGRRALVIFDNCEHVLAGAAAVIGAMTAVCPELRVVATSREALGIPGECVQLLGPLDADDSIELFRARASGANRQLDLAAIEQGLIAELCRRVEGMPLSIELTATRVRTMTLSEILEQLDDVLRDTTFGPGRPERQHGTRSMVEWSYRLLSTQQQTLFDRLSVFAGHFDIDAVIAVCEFDPLLPGSAGELLDALADKSMVFADVSGGSTRFRLLDTLRHFGADQLTGRDDRVRAGEPEVLAQRHLRHFASVARSVSIEFEHDSRRALARLDGHWDNWRLAVGRAIERDEISLAARMVRDLWMTMMTFRAEIATWVAAVRARLADDDPMAAEIYFAEAQWAHVLGDPGRAIDIACHAIELGLPIRGLMYYVIAESETMRGNAAESFAAAVQSLGASDGHASEGLFLAAACRSAWSFEPSQVRPWAERLCLVAAANGRVDDRVRAAQSMGIASLVDGDPAVALAWFQEAQGAAHGLRGLENEASLGVARSMALLGRPDAERSFLDVLTRVHQDGDRKHVWMVLDALAWLWLENERSEDAAVLLGHLEAHVRANSVDAPTRRRAVEVIGADPRLAVFRQRGATMSSDEVVRFAVHALAR